MSDTTTTTTLSSDTATSSARICDRGYAGCYSKHDVVDDSHARILRVVELLREQLPELIAGETLQHVAIAGSPMSGFYVEIALEATGYIAVGESGQWGINRVSFIPLDASRTLPDTEFEYEQRPVYLTDVFDATGPDDDASPDAIARYIVSIVTQ